MKKQKITEYDSGWNGIQQTVNCAVCGHVLNLRTANKPTEKIAWFDPYAKGFYYHKPYKGAYVCFDCLSQKRKDEINSYYLSQKLKNAIKNSKEAKEAKEANAKQE